MVEDSESLWGPLGTIDYKHRAAIRRRPYEKWTSIQLDCGWPVKVLVHPPGHVKKLRLPKVLLRYGKYAHSTRCLRQAEIIGSTEEGGVGNFGHRAIVPRCKVERGTSTMHAGGVDVDGILLKRAQGLHASQLVVRSHMLSRKFSYLLYS